VLIIDEIQKISNWSESVKKEWDSDTAKRQSLKVVLLGSSRLLLQQGLTNHSPVDLKPSPSGTGRITK